MLPLLAFIALAPQEPVQVTISCMRVRLATPLRFKSEKTIRPRTPQDPTIFVADYNQVGRMVEGQLQDGKAKVITAPVVRTLSGQDAMITTSTGKENGTMVEKFKLNVVVRSDGTMDVAFDVSTDEEVDGIKHQVSSAEDRVSLRKGRTVVIVEPTMKGVAPVVTLLTPRIVERRN